MTSLIGKQNGSKFTLHDILQPKEESEAELELSDETNDGFRNRRLHSVSDRSVKQDQIRLCCKILNFENQIVSSKEMLNKQWGMNIPKATKHWSF